MSRTSNEPVSAERLLGGELVRAAEGLLAGLNPDELDSGPALQLATVQVLLGLYWELRHQGLPAPPADSGLDIDAEVGWLSALLCTGLPAVEDYRRG